MKTFDSGPPEVADDRDRVFVGVSERAVASDGETLVAYGVGSCVTVVCYDAAAGVGGMATAVLPSRSQGEDNDDAKYVDATTKALLRELAEAGAGLATLRAKVVGGATIMEFQDLGGEVGADNVRAARRCLDALDVPIVAEAVGGDRGRTVVFDTASGEVAVRTVDGDPERL